MNTIVNIEVYGDFDMPQTAAIMTSPDGMSRQEIKSHLAEISNLFNKSNDVDEAIKHMKSAGFKIVKFKTLHLGAEL